MLWPNHTVGLGKCKRCVVLRWYGAFACKKSWRWGLLPASFMYWPCFFNSTLNSNQVLIAPSHFLCASSFGRASAKNLWTLRTPEYSRVLQSSPEFSKFKDFLLMSSSWCLLQWTHCDDFTIAPLACYAERFRSHARCFRTIRSRRTTSSYYHTAGCYAGFICTFQIRSEHRPFRSRPCITIVDRWRTHSPNVSNCTYI